MNACMQRAGAALGTVVTLVAASALLAAPMARAADVGVSIGISQPGVYGRIDIGRFPQPAVVVAQPVVVAPVRQAPPPVYLWVPPGHRQHWARHCHAYRACGAPVYFVSDDWYRHHVMAERREWVPPHERHGERWHDERHDGRREGGREGWREGDRDGRGERHGHRG